MSKKIGKKWILLSLLTILCLSASAPFLASSNPDGLESVAGNFEEAEGKDASYWEAPLPDYAFEGQGILFESLAIIIGTMVMVALFLVIWKIKTVAPKKADELVIKQQSRHK